MYQIPNTNLFIDRHGLTDFPDPDNPVPAGDVELAKAILAPLVGHPDPIHPIALNTTAGLFAHTLQRFTPTPNLSPGAILVAAIEVGIPIAIPTDLDAFPTLPFRIADIDHACDVFREELLAWFRTHPQHPTLAGFVASKASAGVKEALLAVDVPVAPKRTGRRPVV